MARRRIRVADSKEVLVAWDRGQSVSAIARMLGYTRPTVRKYLGVAQRLEIRPGAQSRDDLEWDALARTVHERMARHRAAGVATAEVATYHDYLAERVGQVRWSVLHQRLRDECGLRASWRTFYRYVSAHWPERRHTAPAVTVRLGDPPPGEEAQVDFFSVGRWRDPVTGHGHRLSAFLLTLSYSRHQFLYPVLSEGEEAWLDAHVAAFTYLGGVPQRLVPDNLTAAIVQADRYDPRLNRAYSELARYYGCLVDPARVAHPKDKPRVERTVAYARESFFRGQDFTSLAQMRAAAVVWAREVAGQRVHGTTGERPVQVLTTREQTVLRPLPPVPWERVHWTSARVHTDCHLRVAGAAYSVPYRYVGHQLEIRLGQRTVAVYAGAELVTSHVRQARGSASRLEHYPPGSQAFLRATPTVCQQRAQALGPATAALVDPLLATRTRHHLREVQALLRLAERYPAVRLECACQRATAVGDGRLRTVRGLLEQGVEAAVDSPAGEGAGTKAVGAFLHGPAAFALGTQQEGQTW